MRYGLLLFAVFLIAGVYVLYITANDSPFRVDARVARQKIASGSYDAVLDVRTSLERATLGHYPQSVHIPAADIELEVPARYPNKEVSILLYCNTGHRARLAAEKLHRLGYRNTEYISGPYRTLI
jgi:phage shock protein E